MAALAVASAVGGALAGCHPTGTPAIDQIYAAALAAVVTVAASRSRRTPLLIFAAIAFAFSRSWLWLPAGAALTIAFGATFQRRPHLRVNALVGAIAVQVLLRLPAQGFWGLTAIVAAVAIAPVLASGWRNSRRRTRRTALMAGGGLIGLGVVLSIPVAVSALVARHPVESGVALARSSLKQVEAGKSPTATSQLHAASADLTSAQHRVGAWWNLGGYIVPGVAQQQRALADATRAGAHLTQVAATDGSKLDLQALRYQGGRINLTALTALAQPVSQLDSAVTSARHALAASRSGWLLPPISDRLDSLGAQVDRAKTSIDLAALGIKDAPAILGGDGVRHYFVAVMTPAETRGLGGFLGAYGVLTVDHGSIKLTASGRPNQLVKPPDPSILLSGPGNYISRYAKFGPQDHIEDVTYSPDMPTVEKVLAQLYPQVSGTHIDGVMILDPYSLAALLHFTGPISVPNLAGQLTSANAADVLLRTQYLVNSVTTSERHDILQSALSEGFHRLTSGSLPSPASLSKALDPVVRQGRLLFWTSHPGDQPLLQRLHLEGAFPRPGPGSDVLAVTIANAANDKLDAYLHQKTTDVVHYDPATGHVTAQVTIRMTSTAPTKGLPAYVAGSYKGSGLVSGTDLDWMSLYTPFKITKATINGYPGTFSSGHVEDGVNAYSAYVTTGAGDTSTVTVTLHGDLPAGSAYHLTTRLQPLANPQSMQVQVVPTGGWLYQKGTAPTWTAGVDEVQSHTWRFGK